jgi:cytochrome c oxidase subunit 2
MGREDRGATRGNGTRGKDWVVAGLIWVVLTALIEVAAVKWTFLPQQFSEEAVVVDDAFQLLIYLAVPVFTLVIVALGYSAFAYRVKERDDGGDGPPIFTNRRVVSWWLVVTTLLAAFVFVNPGLVGLRDLRADTGADLVIHAEARRFKWTFYYPDGQVTDEELVVPVDTRIRFDVTSLDVLHSFWVPAFRMKIDAVPGRTTEVFVTPTRTGSLTDIPNLRVQCAELCGVGHPGMRAPVRVVTESEYEAWIETLEVEE